MSIDNNVKNVPFQGKVNEAFQVGFENGVPAFMGIAVYHPLYTLKTMMQEGRIKNWTETLKLAKNQPKIFFRGFTSSIWSVPPIAFKSFANDRMLSDYKKRVKRELFASEKIGFAAIASVAGGVIAAVSEQFISHQQLTGDKFLLAFNHMLKTGVRGLNVTIAREFCFGLSCFGLVPITQMYVLTHMPGIKKRPSYEFIAGLSCSILGGMVGAGVSQPLDVLKTRIQAQTDMNYGQAFKSIAVQGYKAFFKGLAPRSMGFMLVISIITSMRQVSDTLFGKK